MISTSRQKIPHNEVDFHPFSFWDPDAKLFRWEGQLYRAVKAERAGLYQRLFDEGVIQNLVDKGLMVETELTSLQIADYEIVLRHRELPFISYPYEWCPSMLKDAALTTINLSRELAKHDLTLQDSHPWNVLFDGSKSVFIDFGSIVPDNGSTQWGAYNEFCRFFIYPLRLGSKGYGRIAHWLMHDHYQGVLESEFIALTHRSSLSFRARNVVKQLKTFGNKKIPQNLRPLLKKGFSLAKSKLFTQNVTRQSQLDFLNKVKRKVEKISVAIPRTKGCENNIRVFHSFPESKERTEEHNSVSRVLSEMRPQSVLDFGCNGGWFPKLAALHGSKVVALDADESIITKLYYDTKKKNLPILPLIMDFTNPSPGYGLCYKWLTPATERFKCEMVIGLGLVEYLVFKKDLDFNQIIDGLSVFSNKSVLVDFAPPQDQYLNEWGAERFEWYTLEGFIEALNKRFQEVRILPSNPSPRVLLLCKN